MSSPKWLECQAALACGRQRHYVIIHSFPQLSEQERTLMRCIDDEFYDWMVMEGLKKEAREIKRAARQGKRSGPLK